MEFLSSLTTEIVSKIGELLVGSVVEQCEHLIHPNKSINSFREKYEQLMGMKQALQGKVDADRNNGLLIAANVENWLHKVEGVEAELQQFYEDEVNKNNQRCRYSLSKIAAKKGAIVVSLKEEGDKFLIPISYPAPRLPAGEIFTANIKAFQSRTKTIMEVIETLNNDEFKRISICGMGGVGKTTMVKQVIKIAEANKLFDKVAFAVVSQNVDNWRLQGDIAGMLGLEFKNETLQERAGKILRELKSINKILIVLDDVWTELDFERIGLPATTEYHKGCKILFTSRNRHECDIMGSQKNFIIPILSKDEAWELFREMAGSDTCNKSDIHPIAREVADECGGLPIAIVTIGKMLLKEKKHTWVAVLNQLKNSSVTSFLEMQDSVYSRIQLSYNFLGNEELKDCLLLCCLFPEDFDIPIEVVMRHGLGLGLFKGVGDLLTARNQVHMLVDKLKSRFLLLGSEEEECVKMHDVVRDAIIWIASGERHGYTTQGGVEIERPKGGACDYKAISLIIDTSNKLHIGFNCSNYQLLQVESKEEETIPLQEKSLQGMSKVNVFSFQRLDIPKPSSLFRALDNLCTLRLENCEVGDTSIIGTELPKLEILSFVSSNIKQLPLEIGHLRSLRLLDLSECMYLYKIHSNVFPSLSQLEELYIGLDNFPWQQNMIVLAELKFLSRQLKVLEICVKKFENLFENLVFENLAKFWVYVGQRFSDYDVFRSGYLQSNILQIKDVDCNCIKDSLTMKQLVKNCEILRLKAVRCLKNLNTIHDRDKGKIPKLEKLCVEECNDLEFLVANKSMVDFSYFVELELIDLPNLIGFAEAMVLDVSDHSIPWVEEFEGSEIAEDELHPFVGKLFACDWMQLFPKLQKIMLDGCSSLDIVFDLRECPNLVGQGVPLLFPQMKEIGIYRHSRLRHVWGNVPHNVQGFENLRTLTIYECDSLIYVFTPSIVRALKHLETMVIRWCNSMEELVSTGTTNKKAETIEFAKLVSLELNSLPKLLSFCSDFDFEIAWPSLRELTISDCPGLNPIQIQKAIASAKQDNPIITSNIGSSTITSKKSSTRFLNCCFGYANDSSIKASSPKDHVPSVEGMDISSCSSMPILQHIKIHKCNSVDTIFSHSKRMNVDSFSKVESLVLHEVPNLVSFCRCIWDSSSMDNNNAIMGTSIEGGTRISRVPFIDGFLFPNLSSLEIQNCHKIISLFSRSSSASLKCLKKLDIRNCDSIEEIVFGDKETQQTSEIVFLGLRLLNLKSLDNFRCISSSSYHHLEFPLLEEVSISDCPNIEESCGPLITPKLQDVIFNGENYNIKYMHKGDLNAIIRQCKAHHVVLRTSETLRWSELDQGVMSCSLKNHEKLLKVILFDEILMFRHLKELSVSNCTSLAEVFESEGVLDLDEKKKDFELVKIELNELPKLMHIWKSLIGEVVSFTNLRELRISECHNLTNVLPFFVAQNLVQLQHLSVSCCNMTEEIVIQKDEESEGVNNKAKIIFPELKELYLYDLPNLKCFCSAAYDFELPSCDDMTIRECPSMTTFSHGTVSTPKLSQIFLQYYPMVARTMGDLNSTIHYIHNAGVYEEQMQKSETFGWIEHNQHLPNYITRVLKLNLWGYESLLNCVPSHMMHRFQHLKVLNVKECNSVVEIFESERVDANNEEHGSIMIYQMQEMYLDSLPKLASIWKSHHAWVLGFQNLGELEVKSCHSLKSVFPLSIAKSLPGLVCLTVQDCQMMEEIVAFKTDEGDKISQEPNETKVMIFSLLFRLELEDLPTLKHFCAGPCDLEWPSCHGIIVKKCRKMESFCHGITFTPELDELSVEDTKYEYPEEGLDAIIQIHYQAQNAAEAEKQLSPAI